MFFLLHLDVIKLGIFDSSRERDARTRDSAASKSGGKSSDYKSCPDNCNNGYRGGFKCRKCDGEGVVKK